MAARDPIDESLASLVPEEWGRLGTGSPIAYVAVHSAALIPHEPVTPRGAYFDMPRARAIVVLSELYKPDARAIVTTTADEGLPNIKLFSGPVEPLEEGYGVYTLVLVPSTNIVGAPLEMHQAEVLLEEACGLLTSLCRPAIAWKPKFTAAVMANGSIAPSLGAVRIGLAGGPPLVTQEDRERVARVSALLQAQSDVTQSRLSFALRWWYRSQREEGTDAFLSCWIALEALTMLSSHSSDLRRLCELVGEAYDLSPAAADDRLGLTYLYRLRNGIVHEGARQEVIEPIVEIVARIFRDIFDWVVREPVSKLAEQWLHDTAIAMDGSLMDALVQAAKESQQRGRRKLAADVRCQPQP